ncbi:hypothetical protein [Treponema sp.]|uniref:hypothetical protein n=1 Tax=Treponema sp. TaxID=166 RepID=UPI00298E7A06|nr:hypothetical protein [Treponema sp.]MCR5614504.1 hypothetical protein [Treponema sp.]
MKNALKSLSALKFFPLFLVFAALGICSCKSSAPSFFVYSITEQELNGAELNFALKNFSSKTIESFVVNVELNFQNSESDFYENTYSFEREIFCSIEEGESIFNCIDIGEVMSLWDDTDLDFNQLIEEGSFYIGRIFVTKIVFSDKSEWLDPYGTWAF